jgi:hypothetical protein
LIQLFVFIPAVKSTVTWALVVVAYWDFGWGERDSWLGNVAMAKKLFLINFQEIINLIYW